MTRRYDDEALSRVLGEHAAGLLIRRGAIGWDVVRGALADDYDQPDCTYPRACANQAAFNEDSPALAAEHCERVAIWFDADYFPSMHPDHLLREIETHAKEEP